MVLQLLAIAQHIYGLSVGDTKKSRISICWRLGRNYFRVYNAVSAVVAFALPFTSQKQIGRRKTHALSLVLGGIGLISVYFMPNKSFNLLNDFSRIQFGQVFLAMPLCYFGGFYST